LAELITERRRRRRRYTENLIYRLFRLPGHDMGGGREEGGGREGGREGGGRRDLEHAQRRKVQFLIQFTVTCRDRRIINWIGPSYPGC